MTIHVVVANDQLELYRVYKQKHVQLVYSRSRIEFLDVDSAHEDAETNSSVSRARVAVVLRILNRLHTS